MDAYDCRMTDKQMSKRLDAIYKNPKRHKFLSDFEALSHWRGPRGGKVIGSKLKCHHCGKPKKEHAEKDEQI